MWARRKRALATYGGAVLRQNNPNRQITKNLSSPANRVTR